MVQKLDDSNVTGLTTADDFATEMDVYRQMKIDDFCKIFPDYIPKNASLYPESFQFSQKIDRLCPLCGDVDSDVDNMVAKPICRVLAVGFKLSNTKLAPVVQTTTAAGNSTIKQEPSQPPASGVSNVANDITQKSEATSGNEKQNQDAASAEATHAASTAEENVPIVGEIVAKENLTPESPPLGVSSPVAESTPAKASPVQSNAANDTKAITPNVPAKEQPIPIVDTGDSEESDFEADDSKNRADDNDSAGIESPGEEPDDLGNDLPTEKSQEQMPSQSQLQLNTGGDPFKDDTDSNFFTYFMCLLLVCVIGYVVYHNKSKMLALVLEGRRQNTNGRGGLSRRKHTAAYRKLDSNLEEAITSNASSRSTQVIY